MPWTYYRLIPLGVSKKTSLKTAEFVSVSWEFGLANFSPGIAWTLTMTTCTPTFTWSAWLANLERYLSLHTSCWPSIYWVVVSNIFHFQPYIFGEKSLILTHFVQMGWFNGSTTTYTKGLWNPKTPSDSRRSLVALTLSAWHNFFESNCRCGYSDAWRAKWGETPKHPVEGQKAKLNG